VNPFGIQGDLRRTGNNEDSSYDAVWYSGGHINGDGWTAEIALPFRSIRFPDAQAQNWGLHILRIRPRDSREQHSWVPISRDETCLFCSAGTLNGLENVNQGKNLEVLPYVIGSQSSYLEDEENRHSAVIKEPAKSEGGFGVKYGITSNYTLDFTYNPDFSQIESDAAQINVNRTFAMSYPERRPFFLEGADIFSSRISAVYTRSVNAPVMAGKITGKTGKTTVGYLLARDELTPYIVPFEESSQGTVDGKSITNVVRVKRDFLENSFYGLIATDRRNESNGGYNTTLGFDSKIRFFNNYNVEAHVHGSYTKEPDDSTLSEDFDDIRFGDKKQYDSFFNGETFPGHAIDAGFGRDAEHFNFWAWYEDYSPTFRTENGMVFGNNYRATGLWMGYMFYTDNGKVTERIQPQLDWGRKYNYDGVFKDEWIQPNIWIRFRKQTNMWVGYMLSRERYSDVLVDGIRRISGNIHTEFSAYATGGMWGSFGRRLVRDTDYPRLGYQKDLEFWLTLKPTSQIKLDMSFYSSRIEELKSHRDPSGGWYSHAGDVVGSDWVLRTKLTYQFTRNLFLRLVTQYVDSSDWVSFAPLLSYKLNPFTVFFIGSSHNYMNFDPALPGDEPSYIQTDRTYFIKFQYLLRV
jgi:hypothetical protein